jgi:hypothetical protein
VRVTAGGGDHGRQVLDLAIRVVRRAAGLALAATAAVVHVDGEPGRELLGQRAGRAHAALAERAVDDHEAGSGAADLVGDPGAVGGDGVLGARWGAHGSSLVLVTVDMVSSVSGGSPLRRT